MVDLQREVYPFLVDEERGINVINFCCSRIARGRLWYDLFENSIMSSSGASVSQND